MRTAESYWQKIFQVGFDSDQNRTMIDCVKHEEFISALNEARREALEEAAEKVTISKMSCGDPFMCGCGGTCEYPISIVNKSSILNLIKEIK